MAVLILFLLFLNARNLDRVENGKVIADYDIIYVSTISGHSPVYINTSDLILPKNSKIKTEEYELHFTTYGIVLPKNLKVEKIEIGEKRSHKQEPSVTLDTFLG